MPLPQSTGWRILQMISVFWCILFSITVALGSYWTVYDTKQLLHVMLNLFEEDSKSCKDAESDAKFVRMVLHGSLGITVSAIVIGMLASFAILLEKRWMLVTFIVLSSLLFLGATSFTVCAFLARDKTAKLTEGMLGCGVRQYTILDNRLNRNVVWRYVVDRIQMQAECCGRGTSDYGPGFKHVTMIIGNRTEFRSACVRTRQGWKKQIRPFSCCKRVKDVQQFDPACAFDETSENVNEICKMEKKLAPMPHVNYLFHYALVNLVITFMSSVLITLLSFLAWKTLPPESFVKQKVQDTLAVDSVKAAKLIEEAVKEPSTSERSGVRMDADRRGHSIRNSEGPSWREDSVPRVSSERLAPPDIAPPSYRTPPRYAYSDRKQPTSPRSDPRQYPPSRPEKRRASRSDEKKRHHSRSRR